MTATEARVEVLTAEVRTLMVGRRQVTLSVYRQLDTVKVEAIEPFGRVSTGRTFKVWDWNRWETKSVKIEVVGRVRDGYQRAGTLARAYLTGAVGEGETYREWAALPLIVLAGLR